MAATSEMFGGNYIPDEHENMYSMNLLCEGRTVNLQLFDTPGNHAFYEGNRASCFSAIDVFIVCVSLISMPSVNSAVEFWVPLIRYAMMYQLSNYRLLCRNVPIIIVGCKLDLRDNLEDHQLNGVPIPKDFQLVELEDVSS